MPRRTGVPAADEIEAAGTCVISFDFVYYWNDTEFLTPHREYMDVLPCLPVNAGAPLSTAAQAFFRSGFANVVFLHQHRVIRPQSPGWRHTLHLYARRAQTVRLNNVMS